MSGIEISLQTIMDRLAQDATPRTRIIAGSAIDRNDAENVALTSTISPIPSRRTCAMTTSRKMMGAAAIASTLIAVVPAQADVAIGILIPSSGKGASYGQQQQNA